MEPLATYSCVLSPFAVSSSAEQEPFHGATHWQLIPVYFSLFLKLFQVLYLFLCARQMEDISQLAAMCFTCFINNYVVFAVPKKSRNINFAKNL
jgi:hypothetical protein